MIVLCIRVVLLFGLFVGWIASAGMTVSGSSGSVFDFKTPPVINPVERRRLRIVFSILFLLDVTLLANLINFSREPRWPYSSLKVSIGFGLTGAILLSLAVGFYLGLSKDQRLHKWSPYQTWGIYSACIFFAVNFLVQTLLICLKAWWIPNALRVPFHNEPTVKSRTERSNDSGTIIPITDRLLQQMTDAGPLERLFAQQSSAIGSAQSTPEVVVSVYMQRYIS